MERELLAAIDLDSTVTDLVWSGEPVTGIVVQSSSPGLGTVELTIPVSTDAAADSVLAVAASTAGQKVELDNCICEHDVMTYVVCEEINICK